MAKPDYTFWDTEDSYTLETAAALCCDLEPGSWCPEDVPHRVRHMAEQLRWVKTSILFRDEKGNIMEAIAGTGKSFLRADLRAWAESTNRRAKMPFLFPEDRTPAETTPAPSIRTDTLERLNAVIGLLTHSLAERGGPAFHTPKGPNQSKICDVIWGTADQLRVSKHGLSPSNLNETLRHALSEVEARRVGDKGGG